MSLLIGKESLVYGHWHRSNKNKKKVIHQVMGGSSDHILRDEFRLINELWINVQFCWAVGYLGAGIFFAVVEMAIDTILLSFCIDSEEHNGTPMFAPPLLMDTLTSHTKRMEAAEAARAARKQQKMNR
jgi:hypothetical protein